MNSKKAITLLVLVSMLVALVPIVPASALAVPTLSAANGAKGTTIEVTGALNDVPAGTVVELYWDDTTIAWNGVKGKLNSTTAKGSGNYEVWFDVPEAKQGTHYVWIKSVSTGETKSIAFTVDEKVSLSATSGLRADKIDVSAYGHAADKDVAMVLVSGAATVIGAWPWTASTDDVALDAGETEYTGTLANAPIEPGTFTIDLDGAGVAHAAINIDNADGSVDDTVDIDVSIALAQTVEGTINYATGEYDLTFSLAPAAGFRLGSNGFVKVVDNFYLLSGTGSTSTLGTTTKRVTIPSETAGTKPANGPYSIQTVDAKGNTGLKAFTVGAVITVTPDSGATGDLVTVKGRGFTIGGLEKITYGPAPAAGAPGVDGIALSGVDCAVDDYGTGVVINAAGEFTMSMYIPEMGDEDDYTLQVSDGFLYAEADFEVTALAEITVTPDYGPQGQSISISGVNFPNKKDIVLDIDLTGAAPFADVLIKTVKTNADGSFSTTFRVPAEVDDTYEIKASWAPTTAGLVGDNIMATETFRIGSVLVLLSDDEGPAGLTVTLSGNGFTAGEGWNATFGDEAIFEGETVALGGLLKDGVAAAVFYVPQVDPGVYDITVLDEDTGIEVVTQFTVTDATMFEMDPASAPSGYNVTLKGTYWSEDQIPVFEFWLFNSTEEWDISALVQTTDLIAGDVPLTKTGLPDGDYPGDWEAWWVVGTAAGDLDMGTYSLNITYGDDWFMQTEVVIGDEHVDISPRKASFKIGDTVTFNIEHSFGNVATGPILDGKVKIYNPAGSLFWETDALADWTKSGMYYYVPAADQLENGNPLVLLDDAPLGEWTYKWYENNGAAALTGDSDLIEEGTFMVVAAAADVVSGQVADLAEQVSALAGEITDYTSDFADVQSSIADVSALARDAVAAANAAADAVTAVAATANTASEAAADAADAANAARDAASGLTTLVYGAIGAALVAALAAIVSLMQISRRIAG